MNHPPPSDLIAAIRNSITDEICFALCGSRTGILRWLLGPLFFLPVDHFAHIFARLDNEVPCSGLSGGARMVLPDFSLHVNSRGAEFIPTNGPLLVVSNHPGAYDSLAITASIPRKDLKIVVSDVKFVHSLTAASQYFIYVPPETAGRMATLRSSIQHLKNDGALLIFAHGEVEPDPAVSPGASQSIQDWSPSVEIMLRKVPDAWLQIVIASHMLLPQFFNSPIARLRRQPHTRQKLAEVMQVIQQMLLPKSIEANVRLSFARPVSASELAQGEVMPAVIQLARQTLEEHISQLY